MNQQSEVRSRARFRRRLPLVLLLGVAVSAGAAHAQTAGTEPPVEAVRADIDYRPDLSVADGRDRLDVFMPQGAEGVPVVVFFHGGGLLEGDKQHGAILAQRLVPEGVGVVSANYRLSPAFSHPTHLQDAAAAFAWVVANIADFGGDPGRVFVSGHSAGAYLAAMLALDARLLEAHGLGADAVAGAMPISPFLYVEETAKDRPKTVWSEDPAVWLEASVTPHIAAGKGPMLLVYADGDDDWRRAQNERFAAAMQAAGSRAITATQVAERNHTTVFTGLNEPDDPVGPLLLDFIRP
jgi:acetyl esterase/lipase